MHVVISSFFLCFQLGLFPVLKLVNIEDPHLFELLAKPLNCLQLGFHCVLIRSEHIYEINFKERLVELVDELLQEFDGLLVPVILKPIGAFHLFDFGS